MNLEVGDEGWVTGGDCGHGGDGRIAARRYAGHCSDRAGRGAGCVGVAGGRHRGVDQPHDGRREVAGLRHGRPMLDDDRCSTMTDTPQAFSTGNYTKRCAVANLAVSPIDSDGSFCMYHQTNVEMLADVQGYFAPASADGITFSPLAPRRVLDKRVRGGLPPADGGVVRVETGVGEGVEAVLVNLTMVDG